MGLLQHNQNHNNLQDVVKQELNMRIAIKTLNLIFINYKIAL